MSNTLRINFVLVVYDWGGPVALPWALDHPERVAGLVLCNTYLWARRRADSTSPAMMLEREGQEEEAWSNSVRTATCSGRRWESSWRRHAAAQVVSLARLVMASFQDDQIAALTTSGWSACPSVADGVARAGLPAITAGYLRTAFSTAQWSAAEQALTALRDHFRAARFADEVTYGILLVPDPTRWDTRGSLDPSIRRDQLGAATPDVIDERLPAGRLGIMPGVGWTMVATVTGIYGIALGSYDAVTRAEPEAFTIGGVDTRDLMIRQVWGARVLQGGRRLPDCEANDRWTFTLFPGEDLTDGLAPSGTVLHGKVRFRLGKPTRGIGSARVAPAIAIR